MKALTIVTLAVVLVFFAILILFFVIMALAEASDKKSRKRLEEQIAEEKRKYNSLYLEYHRYKTCSATKSKYHIGDKVKVFAFEKDHEGQIAGITFDEDQAPQYHIRLKDGNR